MALSARPSHKAPASAGDGIMDMFDEFLRFLDEVGRCRLTSVFKSSGFGDFVITIVHRTPRHAPLTNPIRNFKRPDSRSIRVQA
jgi:hypothetical protein